MEEYKNRRKNQSTLEEAINSFLKATRLKSKVEKYDIFEAWEKVLGKAVKNRTEQLLFKENTLIVKMNSSIMRDELFQAKSQIISMLNEHIGKEQVKEIWFS